MGSEVTTDGSWAWWREGGIWRGPFSSREEALDAAVEDYQEQERGGAIFIGAAIPVRASNFIATDADDVIEAMEESFVDQTRLERDSVFYMPNKELATKALAAMLQAWADVFVEPDSCSYYSSDGEDVTDEVRVLALTGIAMEADRDKS